jgi:hypothetical protein
MVVLPLIQLVCDWCKKPLTDVCYRIIVVAPDGGVMLTAADLHYNCIVPWRQADA